MTPLAGGAASSRRFARCRPPDVEDQRQSRPIRLSAGDVRPDTSLWLTGPPHVTRRFVFPETFVDDVPQKRVVGPDQIGAVALGLGECGQLGWSLISATDGRSRRIADVADRGFGRLNWADTAPSLANACRSAIRPKGDVPVDVEPGREGWCSTKPIRICYSVATLVRVPAG